jgi:transcriptional regulator with XRE-family HTH domain
MSDTRTKKPARKPAAKKAGASRAKSATAKSGTTRARTKAKAKAGSRKSAATRPKAKASGSASRAKAKKPQPMEQPFGSLFDGIFDLTSSAMKMVNKTRERAAHPLEQGLLKKPKSPVKTPSAAQLRRMADAGESLRDLREVAGLTLTDITKALKLKDKSFLEAVEDGREALSMEMIMRLASLYARNDPIPFVVNYVRTYSPKLWEVLEEWGLDGLPLKLERERRFINIYKRRDAARQLSNEGFDKVLDFTQQAFELSLHFIAELEEIENEVNPEFDQPEPKKKPDQSGEQDQE